MTHKAETVTQPKPRCKLCGEMALTTKVVRGYKYDTSLGVYLVDGNSEFGYCENCKEEFVPGSLIAKWNKLILAELIKTHRTLSPPELRFVFAVLPYSQNELAKAVGKDRSTLSQYKTGKNPVDRLFDDFIKGVISDYLSGREDTLRRLQERQNDAPAREPERILRVC